LLQAEKEIWPVRVIKPEKIGSWEENDDFLNPRTPPLPPCVDYDTDPRYHYPLRCDKHAQREVEGRKFLALSLARRLYCDMKAAMVLLKDKALHLAVRLKAPKRTPHRRRKRNTSYASDAPWGRVLWRPAGVDLTDSGQCRTSYTVRRRR
jgi:hypothetical protein